MAFSGPQGGPFSPALFEYRVRASTGAVNYSIRTPSWLTASRTAGTTDTSGVTITLTGNASASSLPPGAYGPGVAFTNVSNGQGSATSPAKLITKRRRLLVRRVKSRLAAEGTCWTAAEDTFWTRGPADCWRSEWSTRTPAQYRISGSSGSRRSAPRALCPPSMPV
jgi:hypothetical protein